MGCSLSELPAVTGDGLVYVVVESPRGATSKLKYEPKLEAFTLSRPLPLGAVYPFDWGFVPGTVGDDGDPIDAFVLASPSTFPGLVIRARLLGVVRLEQNSKPGGRERNDRILTIAEPSPRAELRSFSDLSPRHREEIEHFFTSTTFFEHKDAKVLGWGDAADAWHLVERSVKVGRRRRLPTTKRRPTKPRRGQ